jgi:hypothetical protein
MTTTTSKKKATKLWDTRISAFAAAVNKTAKEINEKLADIVGEPSDDALDVLNDVTAVPDTDLKTAFADLKIPSGILNLHLPKLRSAAIAGPSAADSAVTNTYDNLLPTVPEDSSFLDMLKVGGVLKVDVTAVLSAIKAAIASRLNLFDLPSVIKTKMEQYADQQEEPVNEEYFKLQKVVASRSYADVLNALGIEGQFMNENRKRDFLKKLDLYLWDSLFGFYQQLAAWNQSWMAGANNPNAMMMLLMSAKGSGGVMPAGMMAPPETAGLHDEAEAVINSINKVFSGVGIAVARALAYDATRIKKVLEEPQLPATLGVTTREQMLKVLNAGVDADYIRLERNLTRFTLAIMEFPKITVPNEEQAYLVAMLQLGMSISWDKLGFKGKSGIGQGQL